MVGIDPHRQALLREHVEEVGSRPCQWGLDDCSMWAGRWVERVHKVRGITPRYQSRTEGEALISAAGGLENLWCLMAGHFRLNETTFPGFGDVGLVSTSRFGPVGVIFTTEGIALWRAEVGIAAIRPRAETIIRAWTV